MRWFFPVLCVHTWHHRALPTELALPQASLSLLQLPTARTCPLPPGIPSGVSCVQDIQELHQGLQLGILAAQLGSRVLQRWASSPTPAPSAPPAAPCTASAAACVPPRWVPEGSRASSALLLDEHFPVLPQMAGRGQRCGRDLWSPPPAHLPRGGPYPCPVSRAGTSSPDVIFPEEIWLRARAAPKKKGCGDMPRQTGEGAGR